MLLCYLLAVLAVLYRTSESRMTTTVYYRKTVSNDRMTLLVKDDKTASTFIRCAWKSNAWDT